MRNRIILSTLLIILITAGISTTVSAQCYDRGRPRGCWRPRVHVCAPRVVVRGGYYAPRYCPPPPPPRYYAYHHRPRHYRYYHY